MPKFKFQKIGDVEKVNGETQESFRGMMTECDTDTPIERALSQEDAVSYNLWLNIFLFFNISWMSFLKIA